MRVYWLSRLRPYSPSRLSSSSAGITPRISCMMMLALMYGFTPRPMIEAAARPPPEKMFRIPSSGLSVNRLASAAVFTFGTGTFVSARNTSRIPSVKRSLRRMSGARKAVATVSIKVL